MSKDWMSQYENLTDYVAPRSARYVAYNIISLMGGYIIIIFNKERKASIKIVL